MNFASSTDEIADSDTLAAAGTGLSSPLAEVAASEIATAVVTPAAVVTTPVPAPVAVLPVPSAPVVATAPVEATTATGLGLGTLPSSTTATLPMFGALLLVVGLILVLGKLVKRVQGARTGAAAALTVKASVQVGSKERVVWMQAGDTHLLLGVSPGHVQTLHVFDVAPDFSALALGETAPASAEPASGSPASKDFSERLKTLLAAARAKGLKIEPLPEAAQTAAPANEPVAAPARVAATSKPTFSFRA